MTSLYNTKSENSADVFKFAYRSVAKRLDKELISKQQLLQGYQHLTKPLKTIKSVVYSFVYLTFFY